MREPESAEIEYLHAESGLHLLYIDGAKAKNPPGMATGQGAIGVVLKDPSGKSVLDRDSRQVGEVRDPHEAEYKALIAGLQLALKQNPPVYYLAVLSDSRVLVNQVNRLWKSRGHLADLCAQVDGVIGNFPPTGIQVSWIPREWNEAHHQADKALRHPPRV